MRKQALWTRLKAFHFDAETGSEPYSVKLAATEGWSPEFTAIVIEEYRKFLYLTQVSEGQATPSEVIDRAWHMHLTFTRSYWDNLCGAVLQAELHHEPCAGSEEMPRYEEQYEATKALYLEEFGTMPHPMVWSGEAPAGPETGRTILAVSLLIGGGLATLASALALGMGTDSTPQKMLWIFGIVVGVFVVMAGGLLLPDKNRFGDKRKTGGTGVFGIGGCGSGSKNGGGSSGDGGGAGDGGGGCGGGGGGGG